MITFSDYKATNRTVTVLVSVFSLGFVIGCLGFFCLFVLCLCKCIHLSPDLFYIYLQKSISCNRICIVYEEVVFNEYLGICTC